jgi:PqqD family protein of HPr-rel-A system
LSAYARSVGLRIEGLGDTWAVFSPISGDTVQLNTEAAAVLESLADGPLDDSDVARMLATASGTEPDTVAAQLAELWPQLVAVGLLYKL